MHHDFETIDLDTLSKVGGATALPRDRNPVQDGVDAYNQSRQQGNGRIRSAWEGIKAGARSWASPF